MPKAISDLLLGSRGLIAAGEDIPATYIDDVGVTHQTDFASLADAGLVDRAAATRADKAVKVETAETHVAEAKAELKLADPPKPAPADEPKPASHKK
jgi:hypothetical protein